MGRTAANDILEARASMDALLADERRHAGRLKPESLEAREQAVQALDRALSAFRSETQRLDEAQVSSLLDALIRLRASAAAAADFEALQVRLAEVLERLHQPAPSTTYDARGSKLKPGAPASRLDSTF